MNKILLRAPNWVGDALLTTPVVHCLKQNFPRARITVLARPWTAPIFETSPDVAEVMIYQKAGIHQGMKGMWALSQELRARDFDLVIHFPHSFESAWISFLSRVPRRVGYATEARGLLLSHPLRPTRARLTEHQVPFFFHLLEPLGIRLEPSPDKHPLTFTVSPAEREKAGIKLRSLGVKPADLLVALAPGAVYGSAKCWPFERFGQLAERLKREWQAEVLLLGTKVDTLAGTANESPHYHNLLGRTSLPEALALIERSRLMVCNDSGLMHAAAALKVPLAALFGSTNPERTGPWGGISQVIKKDFSCSPCLKKACRQRPTCLEAIGLDDVWETLVQMREQNLF
jgi:heptosyltransferase-2